MNKSDGGNDLWILLPVGGTGSRGKRNRSRAGRIHDY